MSKLSNVVKYDVVKKTVYDKLVTKVNAIPLNNIDTSDFALKTNYNTDKTELEKRIPNVTDFVKKAKLTELADKIPDVSNLATKAVLTTVEKIPQMLVVLLKKQTVIQKLMILKINLLTIITINILILHSLINWLLMFLMQD